jgi:hypothetical protein
MSSERDCLWEGRPESNFDLDDRRCDESGET